MSLYWYLMYLTASLHCGAMNNGVVKASLKHQSLKGVIMSPELKKETDKKILAYKQKNKEVKKQQVVFAGSSLMEMFPIEQMTDTLDLPYIIYNRGVGGYRIHDLLQVLDTCIFDLEPDRVFINIGTNDLSDSSFTMQDLFEQYSQILDEIRNHLPQTRVYLMAYYPVNYEAAAEDAKACLRIRTNERILQANELVHKLADEYGYRFINVNKNLMDEYGRLKAEFTIEGIHIKPEGYQAILEDVLQYVREA